MSITPKDLIEIVLPVNWRVIELSDTNSNWQKNEDGTIEQIASLPNEFGSLLILPSNDNFHSTALRVATPSDGEVGLLFNYIDDENYLIFSIEKKDVNLITGKLISCTSGEFSIIDSKDLTTYKEELIVSFIQVDSVLLVYLEDKEVFRKEIEVINFSTLGLYCNGNNPFKFMNLFQENMESISESNDGSEIPFTPFELEIEESKEKIEDKLNNYLSISPPKSETQVEFGEVFTVPLDSFYVSLYKNYGEVPIRLPGEIPALEIEEEEEDSSELRQFDLDGSIFITYDISPDTFLVLGAKGIENMDNFKFPFESIYTALVNKTSLEPIFEFTSEITDNAIAGILPLSRNHQLSIEVAYESTLILTEDNSQIFIGKFPGGVQFSPSGKLAVGNDYFNNELVLFNTSDGAIKSKLKIDPSNGKTAFSLGKPQFSPDESMLIGIFQAYYHSTDKALIVVWDVETGETKELFFDRNPNGIFFSNDSKRCLISVQSGFEMYDTVRWEKLQHFRYQSHPVSHPTFTPDSKYVITYGAGIEVWSADSGAFYKKYGQPINWAIPITNSEILFYQDNQLRIWDFESDDFIDIESIDVPQPYSVHKIGLSPDASKFFLVHDNVLDVLNSTDKSVIREYKDMRFGSDIAFSSDSTKIILNLANDSVKVLHLDGETIESPSIHINNISRVGCSADGQSIFALDKSAGIHIINSRTGQLVQEIETTAAKSVSISNDGKHILVQNLVIQTNQINPDTHEQIKIPFNANLIDTGIGFLAVASDGSKIVYAGASRTLNLWDFNTSKESIINDIGHLNFNEFQTYFSKDNTQIIALAEYGDTLMSYHIANSKRTDFNTEVRIDSICMGHTEDCVFGYAQNGMCLKWMINDPQNPVEMFNTSNQEKVQKIGVSHNDEMVFLQRSKDISVIRISDGVLIDTIEDNQDTLGFGIWFTPDNASLAVSAMNEVIVHPLKEVKHAVTPIVDDELLSTYAYLLDYRPKRWYRQLKLANDQEHHFNELAGSFKTVITELRTNMFTTPDSTIDDSPSLFTQINFSMHQLNAYQGKEFEATNHVNEALDVQLALSSELRLNGYNLVYKEPDKELEGGSIQEGKLYTFQNGKKRYFEGQLRIQEELEDKGYNFAIIGGRPKVKPYQPFKYDPNLNFLDNAIWKKLWGQLRAYIYNEDALTKENEDAFAFQSKELFNIGVNTKIQTTQTKLENDIKVAKETTRELDDQLYDLIENLKDWTEDLNLIKTLTSSSFKNFYDDLNIKEPKFINLKNHFLLADKTWEDRIPLSFTIGFWPFKHTITIHFERTNYSYAIEFVNPTEESSKFYTAWSYGTRSHSYNTYSGLGLSIFKSRVISIVESIIRDIEENRMQLIQKINKNKNEVRFHEDAKSNLLANSLTEQRKKFMAYWNDPHQFGAYDTLQNEIMPEADPLADLLVSLQYPEEDEIPVSEELPEVPLQELKWKTDYFKFSGNRFYNEEGHTLQSYLEFLKGNKSKRVAIFPKMEDDGTINDDAFIAVVNPQPALTMDDDLPVIKFVETYRIGIRWTGYSLGELSHTENLFPNETKEIKIERTTKLVRKQEESRSDLSTTSSKNSSSFEENLQKEVSLKEIEKQTQESTTESSTTNTSETESENVKTDTKELSFNLDLKKVIPGIDAGIKGKNNSVNKKTDKNKDTFEKSQKSSNKMANEASKEAFSKDTSNTIRKVAHETSQENKVEIKVNNSEEYSETSSRSEFINIENPNMGRTINYQFFQVQNGYEVTTTLIDVKVVVDMNREIIKGSTVTDVRVFDLEELGKIFSDESEDPRYMLTAAIIARQAFKNYLSGVSGIGRGNGALKIKKGYLPNLQLLEIVNFSKKLTKRTAEKDNLFEELREAMTYLKQVPFEFVETDINTPKEFHINAGSYYLDAEVGNMAATEKYLEDRRDIETQKQQSQVEHLIKKTENDVFFPEIPGSVTHLNMNDDIK